MIEIIFTANTTWTVPNDWSSINTIEVVGAGGGGASWGIWRYNYPFGWNYITHGLAGAGGGIAMLTNLNSLQRGQQINITVGLGGLAGRYNMPEGGLTGLLDRAGRSGGTTHFGNFISALGGQTGNGGSQFQLYVHVGGYGLQNNSLINGTYESFQNGAANNYTNTTGLPTLGISPPKNPGTLPGSARGGYAIQTPPSWIFSNPGGLAYGQGGLGECVDSSGAWALNPPNTPNINQGIVQNSTNGASGAVRIRYVPTGVQQPCVWIS